MLIPKILEIRKPAHPLPVIFDSPHSGCIYPSDFKFSCDLKILKRLEDSFVDDLFSCAPDHGATLLCANFPRSYIDVNRARNDIDETLIEGAWNQEKYGNIKSSSRSDAGIGLISRLIKPGIPIYNRKLGAEEVMNRVMTYYDPYHDTLRTLLDDAYYDYGQFWHINCHSMPMSSATPKNTSKPSDIVLGDRDGQTCERDFLYALRDFWKDLGYRVTINDPFKGVELIRKYSQPTRGKNSVQIEINRALYMDEETGKKSKNYADLKAKISHMVTFCTAFAQSKLTNMAAD